MGFLGLCLLFVGIALIVNGIIAVVTMMAIVAITARTAIEGIAAAALGNRVTDSAAVARGSFIGLAGADARFPGRSGAGRFLSGVSGNPQYAGLQTPHYAEG